LKRGNPRTNRPFLVIVSAAADQHIVEAGGAGSVAAIAGDQTLSGFGSANTLMGESGADTLSKCRRMTGLSPSYSAGRHYHDHDWITPFRYLPTLGNGLLQVGQTGAESDRKI